VRVRYEQHTISFILLNGVDLALLFNRTNYF